ncbi:MAG: GGDEF domain-containing protein [Gammaproteobacteria bacterium]|nr:GGDEF domain-containing protein [Gammaproteobacteria bacterium]
MAPTRSTDRPADSELSQLNAHIEPLSASSTLGTLASGPAWTDGQQLRMGFRNLIGALAASTFCAFVTVALLWQIAPPQGLILWLGSISTLTLLRLMMQQQYQSSPRTALMIQRWKRGYVGATFAAGCVWGSLGLFLFPAESILHQAYLALILGGISAGAVTTYAPVPAAFQAFVIPALGPFALQIALSGHEHSFAMSMLIVLFTLTLMRTASESRSNVVGLLEAQLKNADLTRELHHRATHDSLVNLVNHGEFERRLLAITTDLNRADDVFSVIFLDLDLFKAVNDTGGHAAGDKILRAVAEILRRNTRGSDTAARVGGDEFAAILEGCPQPRALEIAERIRDEITNTHIEHDGRYYSVNASIGVAYGLVGEHTVESMLKAADAACYAAKEEGRNRVCNNDASGQHESHDRFELTQSFALSTFSGVL